MAHATATIGMAHYATTVEAHGHRIVSDEPLSNGGGNTGPGPYDLLLASLSACTAITLRMYADRKQWDLKSVTVGARLIRMDKKERIDRTLRLEGNLNEEQRARIAEIAERTPVTLTLKGGLPVYTTLEPA
jgi:putative redox protein